MIPKAKPQPVQVVNLLVTPEQAEVLSLASNEQVKIQLVLRNPLDTKTDQVPGTAMTNLFADPGYKKPASTGHVRRAAPDTFTIEVINGSKAGEEKFQFFRGKAVRVKAGNTIACFCAVDASSLRRVGPAGSNHAACAATRPGQQPGLRE